MSPAAPAGTALVTNATGFAGPPAVTALLEAGFRVLAHDPAFGDSADWERFRDGRDDLLPIAEAEPEAVVARAFEHAGALHTIVSNDHFPAPAQDPDTAPAAALRDNHEALVVFPFRLIQAALPRLRRQEAANIVMITSNRTRLPLSGGAFPDAARAGVNALVRSLAIDCARDGITVNAIAPNYLYSEAYYPRAFFKDTEEGRAYVRRTVPIGRLAEPEEIGEVIAFLATAKTRFLTGAVIDFSGGWPFGEARPPG
ncbi:short-chain dehydrogenase/reductase SDR [Caenispirillum salinarum AK4]|uniref:Short-chain dehydrogenase/reductase SDR n=1 Tax=Caenispirillum salinarum AK4 TaxID=1238182 RepID=K9H6M8_9PROT|nr:SDR family oxidoreductase [Caenispirillum salinarum]EKV32689.1 short-chain dehydrogenase/reductase SDR [Caenispirillum salinarum AK4]